MTARLIPLLLACLVTQAVSAATVFFEQQAVDDSTGSVIGAVSSGDWLDTGQSVSTVAAPSAWSGYRFTRWSNDSYPGEPYRDAWGRSLNPISFILLEDTVATAHYLPQSYDGDLDGVPDWFEIEYYGDLAQGAASDTDGDGLTLAQEHAGGTHPLYGDSSVPGGVFWADSQLVVANLAGYASYTIRSVPAGTVDAFAYAPPGTVVTTPDLGSDPSFGYWELDGVRQQDAWGVAWPQINFTAGTEDREAVAYLFTGDSDGDGISDAFEQYYYGTLTYGAGDDTDGDGLTLAQERAGGTHPLYAESSTPGGVYWDDSETVVVNLADFSRYTFSSVPAGVVSESAIVPDGTTVTTPAMDQSGFGYWAVDGVRQEDAWGVALRQVSFLIDGADRSAVAHILSGDSDGDGVSDGFEQYYYGTLAYGAGDDTDGDGLTLQQELAGGTHPLYAESSTPGGVFWVDSPLVVANLQPFELLERIRVDGVLTPFFSPDPAAPGGVDVGEFASVAASDWDGDGDLDLFVAHAGGLRVWQNTGTANNPDFTEVLSGFSGLSFFIASVNRPRIAGGDWNGDGYGDLAIGGDTGILRLVASSGAWSSDGTGTDLVTGSSLALPAFGDMNGDGDTDLLVLLADGSVRLYLSDGTAWPYGAPGIDNYLGASTAGATGITTGDIDQDGRTDVLVSDADGRIWEFLQNVDGSFFLRSKVWGGSYAGFASDMAIGAFDLEGDGDLDLIGGLENGGLVALRDPRLGRPTGLVATPGAESILLTWNPSWQSRIKGYYLYRADLDVGPFANLTGTIIPLPRYNDTSVLSSADYFYYATAISQFFEPGNSEPRTVESLPSDLATVSAGEVTLSMRPIRGRPGNFVKVQLSIDNAMGIRGDGMVIDVAYDPAVIIPGDQASPSRDTVLSTGLSRNLVFSDNGASASGTLMITGTGGSLEPGSGKLFTLQFKVVDSAALGQSSPITISAATLYSLDGYPVTVNIDAPALIEVSDDFLAGDVNGDGLLTAADEDLLKQLTRPRAPEPTPEQLVAGDLNGDGVLNPQDVVLLKRLLRGLEP